MLYQEMGRVIQAHKKLQCFGNKPKRLTEYWLYWQLKHIRICQNSSSDKKHSMTA